MKYKRFLQLEAGSFQNKRYIVTILLFLLLAGYFVQVGIGQYRHILKEEKRFQHFEKEKYKQFIYPTLYGNYGLRLLFVPSAFMALADTGIIPNYMTTFIDASERMKIYQPLKGQGAFFGLTSGFINYSGYVLLFGSLLALIYGFIGTKNHEWLKFLTIIDNRNNLLLPLLAAKATIILLICLILKVMSAVLFLINGVGVNLGKILVYGFVLNMVLFVFLLIGMVAGTFRHHFSGWVLLVASWVLLTFLLPALIYQWTYNRADTIKSTYDMEYKKQKRFMAYETDSFEKEGKFNDAKRGSEREKEMFLAFWNNGFKEVMAHEKNMLGEMKSRIDYYQTLAGLFPSSFFLSLSNELSSRGFSNLIAFNEFSQQMKKDFIWYIAENHIMTTKKKFKPFIKGHGNIYQGKSRLPGNFSFGLAVTSFWLIGALFLYWLFFNRLLDQSPETENDRVKEPQPKDIRKNKITLVVTPNPWRRWQLLLRLKVDKAVFLPVPRPDCLPGDLTASMILSFFSLPVPDELQPVATKYCDRLSLDHKGLIILEIIKTVPVEVLIFDDFLTGLSEEFRETFKKYLHDNRIGRRVAYFSNSLAAAPVCTDSINYKSESPLPVP